MLRGFRARCLLGCATTRRNTRLVATDAGAGLVRARVTGMRVASSRAPTGSRRNVTHVFGTICYLCVRNRPAGIGGEGGIRTPDQRIMIPCVSRYPEIYPAIRRFTSL